MNPLARFERLEWLCVVVAAALLAAAMPLQAGELGWGWDALSHHVYLGFIAQQPRWHLDLMPASVQTFQYPYLYWPVYLLSQWQGHPAVGAALWSGFQAAMVAAPLWLAAHRLMPPQPRAAEAVALRTAACVAGFSSVVVLGLIEGTNNDLLASVPLLWALAVSVRNDFSDRRSMLAAALWGVSVAFKWSNGLFLPWLLLWWYRGSVPHWPLRRALCLLAGATLGWGAAYAPWGWQLWQEWGNPFHPLFGQWFARG